MIPPFSVRFGINTPFEIVERMRKNADALRNHHDRSVSDIADSLYLDACNLANRDELIGAPNDTVVINGRGRRAKVKAVK